MKASKFAIRIKPPQPEWGGRRLWCVWINGVGHWVLAQDRDEARALAGKR